MYTVAAQAAIAAMPAANHGLPCRASSVAAAGSDHANGLKLLLILRCADPRSDHIIAIIPLARYGARSFAHNSKRPSRYLDATTTVGSLINSIALLITGHVEKWSICMLVDSRHCCVLLLFSCDIGTSSILRSSLDIHNLI